MNRDDCFSDAACVEGRCVFRGANETCDTTDECSKMFVCVQGVCASGGGVGASCDADSPCGLSQFEGRVATVCVNGTCEHVAGPGEPCFVDAQCPPIHRCVASSCTPLPDIGEPCDPATFPCVRGACSDGTCAWLMSGETCSSSNWLGQCEDGQCLADICSEDLADGEACDRHEECGAWAWCERGGCVTARHCAVE